MDQVQSNNQQAVQTQQAQVPQPSTQPSAQNQPKKNYFGSLFSGRVNRRNFIIGNILPTIILIQLNFALISVAGLNARTNMPNTYPPQTHVSPANGIFGIVLMLVMIIVVIFTLIYTFSLNIRRLHDLDKTGWLCLLSFIPFISFLLGIYVVFFPGTKGENKYGAQPLPRINIPHDILKLS